MSKEIHHKIAKVLKQMHELEEGHTHAIKYMALETKLEGLYQEYREHNGFDYHPLFYQRREQNGQV